MGIKGLHKALEEFSREGHVSMFVGEKVAVDAYAWLHKVRKRPAACMVRGARQLIFTVSAHKWSEVGHSAAD